MCELNIYKAIFLRVRQVQMSYSFEFFYIFVGS
jgi:hypothetical protein